MLSELEHVVLGVVGMEQPCTAYTVRQVFRKSPSSHWSGSAGAIYPLVRRLEKQRLLRSTARRGDRRSARLYRLTNQGQTELRAWLRPPLPDASALMDLDPLRVRIRFLGALREKERRAVLTEAQVKLRAHLERLQDEVRQDRAGGDLYRYLVSRGAIRSVRAQLSWLAEVEHTLQPQ